MLQSCPVHTRILLTVQPSTRLRVQMGLLKFKMCLSRRYNCYMGGVNMSDQYIFHQTKKYWKTLFYHTIEIAVTVTNAFLLYQQKTMTENPLRTTKSPFGSTCSEEVSHSNQNTPTMDITAPSITVSHGSHFFANWRHCAICNLKTTRRCPDCPRKPTLCQTPHIDCHSR